MDTQKPKFIIVHKKP